MSLHSDEQFLAAVAAALGESLALVRRRGFHLEFPPSGVDPRPGDGAVRQYANEPDDAVDLESYGIDWDAHVDCRRPRRRRRASPQRGRRRAA